MNLLTALRITRVFKTDPLSTKDVRLLRKAAKKAGDAVGVALADEVLRKDATRAEIILGERERLIAIMERDFLEGDSPTKEWSRGYTDASKDVIDMLRKGE